MLETQLIRHGNAVRPERVCPDCSGITFHQDEEYGELICSSCGLVVHRNRLPERDLGGYEQETHSAECDLDFHEGKGSYMDMQTYYTLLKKRSERNVALRLRMLKSHLSDRNEASVRRALEYASRLLKDIGLWNTAQSPNQESRLSHVYAHDLGRLIRKFYSTLEFVLKLNVGAHSNSFFTFKHQVVVQNLLGMMLMHEALNNTTTITVTEASSMAGKPLLRTVNNGLCVHSIRRGGTVISGSNITPDLVLQAGDRLELVDTRRLRRIMAKLPLFSNEAMLCLQQFLRTKPSR